MTALKKQLGATIYATSAMGPVRKNITDIAVNLPDSEVFSRLNNGCPSLGAFTVMDGMARAVTPGARSLHRVFNIPSTFFA